MKPIFIKKEKSKKKKDYAHDYNKYLCLFFTEAATILQELQVRIIFHYKYDRLLCFRFTIVQHFLCIRIEGFVLYFHVLLILQLFFLEILKKFLCPSNNLICPSSGVSLEAGYWRSTAAYVASHRQLLNLTFKKVVVVISSTETGRNNYESLYFIL